MIQLNKKGKLFYITFILICVIHFTGSAQSYQYPFRNVSLSFEQRVADLVSRLTLAEKIRLMQNNSAAVSRLGIPAYNWWNECLHGVARDGVATVFPQAIGMSAMWDFPLMNRIGDAISTEARAKHEEHVRNGETGIYQGLTFWTPNINIFRDPRWGRGQETYGEDPFLTSQTGIAFVTGLQGKDPKYFKVIATAKHFAVHSGSEYNRHKFDAVISDEDLFDTYLPAFESLVKGAGVYSVMAAYNSVNGVPACANTFLLDSILRKRWKFEGYVVSDCGAITDIYQDHNYVATEHQAAAAAVKAGCDLTCGGEYISLQEAINKGEISEKQIDISVSRLLLALIRLGIFDDNSHVPYANIPVTENNDSAHNLLSKQASLESMVLLQNKNNLLPLSGKAKTIAVVGPFADDAGVLLGNYNGTPTNPITFFHGIQDVAGDKMNIYTNKYIKSPDEDYANESNKKDSLDLLVESCSKADLVVFCGGLTPNLEGEESSVDKKGFFHGDRTSLNLPDIQEYALKALKARGKRIILILTNGGALSLNWEQENLDAIIEAWYPGQNGGSAVADIIFGKYNPAGRLPVTFYKSVKDLPGFENYNMKGRTYRYFMGKPLYPFGYGLSYARFSYNDIHTSTKTASAKDSVMISFYIKNTSSRDGDEVMQVYGSAVNISQFRSIKTLIGFQRVHLKANTSKHIQMKIGVNSLRQFDAHISDYNVYKGTYAIMIGSSSEDVRLKTTLVVK